MREDTQRSWFKIPRVPKDRCRPPQIGLRNLWFSSPQLQSSPQYSAHGFKLRVPRSTWSIKCASSAELVVYENVHDYRQWMSKRPNEEPVLTPDWQWPPRILQDAIGIDLLESVYTIDMRGSHASEEEIARWHATLPHDEFLR